MKKLLKEFIIISFAAFIFLGVYSYFPRNAEADEVHIKISVNDQKPWSETFYWDNFLPGDSKKINLAIKNTGTDPARIWKRINNLTTEENGITNPEGEWYDANNVDRGIGKNDMDSAIIYDLRVDGNIIINKETNISLSDMGNGYKYLGELASGAEMTAEEEYYLKSDAENWLQSDKMIFDTEILALSLDAPVPETRTININELGGDIASQYGYQFDYSGAAVNFTYDTPATEKLRGVINATGLKPYATYQVKFEGKPVCQFGAAGNDLANENIGYKGRWWDRTINSNVNDTYYEANSIYKGGTHCITGYLVWDFFTVNADGNASKIIETTNSYHVLFANGGVCGSTDNSHLSYLDSAHPSVLFAAAGDVGGQLERGACGGLVLNSGDYDLRIVLTEESFHQGSWATVLGKDIGFRIE